jgi:hypothetical protein
MTVTSGSDKSDLHKQNVRVCFFSEQNTSVATRNKFSESSVEVRGTVTAGFIMYFKSGFKFKTTFN